MEGSQMNTITYFAYGSNMDPERMQQRCPRAEPVGTAVLAGHMVRIGGRGVATTVEQPAEVIHGVCWTLGSGEEAVLDRVEGVSLGLYRREWVDVVLDDGSGRQALTYVEDFSGDGLPRRGYLETILRGAREFRLPEPYIARLALLSAPGMPS